jgi:LPXTG-site transpeptidase (sortase) family protein
VFTRHSRREPRPCARRRPRPWLLLFLAGALVMTAGLALTPRQTPSGRDLLAAPALDLPRPAGLVVPAEPLGEASAPPRRSRRDPATAAPVALHVPRLGVHAPVVRIRDSARVLVPPSDPQTLGWWSAGAAPGALRGGALITGHTVHSGGGAFDNLETLQAGDRVRVRTAEGVIPYVVRGVTVYRKATLARDAERVFSQTVPGRLVLITCEDWNGTGYDSNAIVFAERRS